MIVTSYVFRGGEFCRENLKKLVHAVGKEHIVLDLSCRKQGEDYYVVTDRWQKYTNLRLNAAVLEELSSYCDEFLIHGVDVEGKRYGNGRTTCTYAWAMGKNSELHTPEESVRKTIWNGFGVWAAGQLDFTIGSALDLFGGTVHYRKIVNKYNMMKRCITR